MYVELVMVGLVDQLVKDGRDVPRLFEGQVCVDGGDAALLLVVALGNGKVLRMRAHERIQLEREERVAEELPQVGAGIVVVGKQVVVQGVVAVAQDEGARNGGHLCLFFSRASLYYRDSVGVL